MGAPSSSSATATPLSFDEGLNQLEALVQQLENGSLGLEAALSCFEKGIALSKTLQTQLEDTQRKVAVLKQSLGGEYKAVPFEGEVE